MPLVTPPPAVPGTYAPPSSRIQYQRRRPADIVLMERDPGTGVSRFEGLAAFLVSLTVHLIVLVVLALIVRKSLSPGLVELRMSQSPSDQPVAFQLINLPEIASTSADESAQGLVAIEYDILHTLEELQVEPPATLARANAMATHVESEINQPTPSGKRRPDVTFFGTHAYGTKFVYVLDVSGSMLSNNGARIRRARQELIRSVNQLGPEHSFYVVLYSNYAITMFREQGQPRLLPADEANKKRAAQWVNFVTPSGGTEPGHALRIAGELAPDAVFFLSDGEFVFEPPSGAAIDQFLQGFGQARRSMFRPDLLVNSPYPKQVLETYPPQTVVHTIALESETSRHLMARIAESTGGQYRFIPTLDRSQLRRRASPRR